MLGLLRSLWSYRYFVINSIWNEFYLRFARSRLGGVWLIFHPLSQVMIYAFILSNVLSAKLPNIDNTYGYAIYLMSGLLAWNLFSEVLDGCMKVFVSNGNSLKKINFPKIALPIIVIGTALLNNIILFLVMLIIFVLLGHPPSWALLAIFAMMPVVVLLGAGIGIFLGIINVFIRDVEQAVPIFMQVLFWFTPIVYPSTIIPPAYLPYLKLSPTYHFVEYYHQIIIYHHVPPIGPAFILLGLGLVMCAVSVYLFRRAGPEMVDVL